MKLDLRAWKDFSETKLNDYFLNIWNRDCEIKWSKWSWDMEEEIPPEYPKTIVISPEQQGQMKGWMGGREDTPTEIKHYHTDVTRVNVEVAG